MSALSDRLRTARKTAGKKQKEVADYLKIPATTYANYEQNKSEPSLSRLQEIASFLDTTTDYLLGSAEAPDRLDEDITLTRILGLLKQKGIKDKDLIDGIGLNKSAISDWKSGRSKSYKRHIDKIADYLDVSTEYLLGRSDDPNPRPEDAVIVRGDFVGPVSPEEKAWLESVLDAYRARKE